MKPEGLTVLSEGLVNMYFQMDPSRAVPVMGLADIHYAYFGRNSW